jgi:SAM-dependent methyltransferase
LEHAEYQRIQALAANHWWYQSLIHIASTAIGHLPDGARILDAGCGTGFLLQAFPEHRMVGVDQFASARAIWTRSSLASVSQGSLHQLPHPDRTFDLVFCLDVLYHRDIADDQQVIQELHRVIKPDGRLILQLAAFDQLRNRHDAVVHTARRYTSSRVTNLLSDAGFHIQKISYRNVLAALAIALSKFRRSPGSNLTPVPRWLNRLLYFQSIVEWASISAGFTIPVGSSVIAVSKSSADE